MKENIEERLPLPSLPFGVEKIKECIPHRYPFLLIDTVEEVFPAEKILATKAVTYTDAVFQGHFPENPVYPGVLLLEGMAQTAAVLGNFTLPGGLSTCLLTEITKARFRRQVVPGDIIRYEIVVTRRRPPFHWFEAKAMVGDEIAAQVSLSAHIQ